MLGARNFVEDVSSFKEREFRFSEKVPYRMWRRHFHTDQRVCLHYHQAIEILVCEKIIGRTRIQGIEYDLQTHPVVVIPPFDVHAHSMRKSPGSVLVFQLSIPALAPYLNIEKLFAALDRSIQHAPHVSNHYISLKGILKKLEHCEKERTFKEINLLLSVFDVVSRAISLRIDRPRHALQIRKIIDWTGRHYRNRILIQEIAEHLGLTKHYFCKYFKHITGTTYIDYLNQVRLDHAKTCLLRNSTVTEACYESGFGNLPYFIQLFKKHTAITPAQFKKRAFAHEN